MNELSNYELLRMIYFAAKSEPAFNKNNYFWKLGENIVEELEIPYLLEFDLDPEEATLFGIEVKVDKTNIWSIRLFKDVTENYLGSNKTTLQN